jgi:sulfate/thiosulfate transport system permease protein
MSALPQTAAPPVEDAPRSGSAKRRLVRASIVGLCFLYVGVLLLLPLVGIIWTAMEPGLHTVIETFQRPDVQHAFFLTGVITVITLIVTTFFGVITAWVLVRQRFPGKSLLNALVDLPFALSPVTVGLAAAILFGLGGWLYPFFDDRGIKILFAVPSMVLVTIFICIPFTIREVVPVLQEIGKDEEDAARTLGASILQTWRKVTMPNIRWGRLYGIALTTARSVGEIGAVLIVSGLIRGKTETATLFIFTAIEERETSEAYIVALTLAAVSIVLLVTIEAARRRIEGRKVHA